MVLCLIQDFNERQLCHAAKRPKQARQRCSRRKSGGVETQDARCRKVFYTARKHTRARIQRSRPQQNRAERTSGRMNIREEDDVTAFNATTHRDVFGDVTQRQDDFRQMSEKILTRQLLEKSAFVHADSSKRVTNESVALTFTSYPAGAVGHRHADSVTGNKQNI